jgi:hypothetical protein
MCCASPQVAQLLRLVLFLRVSSKRSVGFLIWTRLSVLAACRPMRGLPHDHRGGGSGETDVSRHVRPFVEVILDLMVSCCLCLEDCRPFFPFF